MKIETAKFCAMAHRHLLLLPLVLLGLAGPARGQVTINLDNSGQQYLAVDTARHFLYAAEAAGPGGTKHLDVINTLTNTVVGSYNFTASGYSSQIGVSGNSVVWADQGGSALRVLAVNGSGVPSLTRTDSRTLATGAAGLATTYAVSKQGTGDFMDIVNTSTGTVQFSVNLSGVAGQVFADSNTNRYYARSSSSYKAIDASTGGILGTLNGFVMAIDSSASHNFVYMQDGTTSTRLDQMTGSSNSLNTYYDFGSAFSDVAVNSATGDIFVALSSANQVIQLNSSMAFVSQYSVTNPQSLAFADGELFVHSAGAAYLTAITAIPEPATWSAMLGGLGLVGALLRRRATRRSL